MRHASSSATRPPSFGITVNDLHLEREASRPLSRQLADFLRRGIIGGRYAAGARLPPTRALAEALECSRTTVMSAFDQLKAEGYLEGVQGSGTRISSLPVLSVRRKADRATEVPGHVPQPAAYSRTSERASKLVSIHVHDRDAVSPWSAGRVDHSSFPFDAWSACFSAIWRKPADSLFDEKHPQGHPSLREAIAEYLIAVRSVQCDASQIIVTSGTVNSLSIVLHALLDPGDSVWLEQPGFSRIRGAVLASGGRPEPVAVDASGLVVEYGMQAAPHARAAIVTPTHQFPLGMIMSLERRAALMEWATVNDAWIIEDDYNSEFRYGGQPLSPLQSLDGASRVLYLGTFSKLMFPTLRLAYVVAPPSLVPTLVAVRSHLDGYPSVPIQPVMARFIRDGHLARHVWRMRRLYQKRQQLLLDLISDILQGLFTAQRLDSGLHVVAKLVGDAARWTTDTKIAELCAKDGVRVQTISTCFFTPPTSQGLILGFASLDVATLEAGIHTIRRATESAILMGRQQLQCSLERQTS